MDEGQISICPEGYGVHNDAVEARWNCGVSRKGVYGLTWYVGCTGVGEGR